MKFITQPDQVVINTEDEPHTRTFTTLVTKNNLKYQLNWASTGENILNWNPVNEGYELLAQSANLAYPDNISEVWAKESGGDQALQLVRSSQGITWLNIASDSEVTITNLKKYFLPKVQLLQENSKNPSVNFWFKTNCGPSNLTKQVEVPTDDSIFYNYSSIIREQLTNLKSLSPEIITSGGKLILLHGQPGTGKTYFVRYLMHNWRKWCTFQYISDPEAFFEDPSYLFQVTRFFQNSVPSGDDEEYEYLRPFTNKWNLIVLEDAGEFIVANNPNEFVAKSLNKLLNITDGLLGQGLKLLILITTNQAHAELNPAMYRSGRCIASIDFPKLSATDAQAWAISQHKQLNPRSIDEAFLLSDLYNPKGLTA